MCWSTSFFFLSSIPSHDNSDKNFRLLSEMFHEEEEEEEEEEELVKQDILQRSSLVFPWPSHSLKHTVDRLNEDSQWKMKAEDEEALFLMSNANCALFFVNFDISGANFKAIERIPHFWRLATNGPPEPTDKLTNKTKQPGPTSLPPSTPRHLNERSPPC